MAHVNTSRQPKNFVHEQALYRVRIESELAAPTAWTANWGFLLPERPCSPSLIHTSVLPKFRLTRSSQDYGAGKPLDWLNSSNHGIKKNRDLMTARLNPAKREDKDK